MEIIPAIDLRNGRCVRLVQGDYEREMVFADDPVEVARRWEDQGALRLHIVDLDGAREGRPQNLSVVADICAVLSIPVQLGGGIRNELSARRALDIGVQRVIIGTAALDPKLAERLASQLGDSLAVGIDARQGKVAVRGWLDTTDVSARDLAREVAARGVRTIVFTDVLRDGMLTGPNVAALKEIVAGVEAAVIASGGISSTQDIAAVKQAGAAGAIIGMALYSGRLSLDQALEAAAC